jgi:hypothetical protein
VSPGRSNVCCGSGKCTGDSSRKGKEAICLLYSRNSQPVCSVCGLVLSNERSIFDLLHQLVHFATPRAAEYFVLVIAAIEFALTWQNAGDMERPRTPNGGDYQFLPSDRVRDTCSLANCFIRSIPSRIAAGPRMRL